MSRSEELIEFCKSQIHEKCMTVGELKELLSPVSDHFYIMIRGAQRRVSEGGWPSPLQVTDFSPSKEHFKLEFVLDSPFLVIDGLINEHIKEENRK